MRRKFVCSYLLDDGSLSDGPDGGKSVGGGLWQSQAVGHGHSGVGRGEGGGSVAVVGGGSEAGVGGGVLGRSRGEGKGKNHLEMSNFNTYSSLFLKVHSSIAEIESTLISLKLLVAYSKYDTYKSEHDVECWLGSEELTKKRVLPLVL